MAKTARKSEKKFVTIAKDGIEAKGRVTERAFDEVWSKKGFNVVDETGDEAAPATEEEAERQQAKAQQTPPKQPKQS